VLLLAGCDGQGADPLRLERPIYNGVVDPGHPAVGMLTNIFCTATLVGPRTALTAAHCLHDPGPYALRLGETDHPAAKVIPHPDWKTVEGPLPELKQADWKYSVNDIGVLILAEPVQDVAPLRLARLTPSVGETVTLVGFGVTGDGSSGKHMVDNTVGCVGDGFVLFGTIGGLTGGDGSTCTGDSGGPALVVEAGEERVLAVHSMAVCGKYTQCTRVAPYLDWLAQQAAGDLAPDPAPLAVAFTATYTSPAPPAAQTPPAQTPPAAQTPSANSPSPAGCSAGSAGREPAAPLAGLALVLASLAVLARVARRRCRSPHGSS